MHVFPLVIRWENLIQICDDCREVAINFYKRKKVTFWKLFDEKQMMKNKIFATQKLRILRPSRIAREKLIYHQIKHFLALICIP
jgi:creatinine amidohydrolase/Fe(II)-dependent formamide hydrolase-like protein